MKKTKLISLAVFPLVLGLLVGCGNKPAPANEAKVKINEETKQMVKTDEGKGDALEFFKLSNVGLEAGDSLSFTYKGNLVDSQTYQAEPLALNNIDVVEVPVEVKFAVHNDVEDASINFWVYENNKYEVFVDGREEDPEPEVTYSFTIGATSYEMVEDPTEPGLFGGSATLHKDDVVEFYEDEVKITSNIAVVSGENNLVPDNTGKFKVLFDYTPESALDMSVTLRVNSGTYNVWADGYQSPTPEPVYTMTMNDGTPVTLTIADDGKAEGVEHQYATNVGVLENDSLKFYKDGELLTQIGADVDDNNNVANTESGMVVRTSYTPEEGYSVYLKLWQEDGGYSVWGVGYQQPGPQPTVPEYSMHGTADGQTWEDTPLTQSQGKETQYEVTNIELTQGYTFVIQLAEGEWYNYNNVKNGCKDLVEKAAGESNDIVLKEEGTYNIYCDSVEGNQNGIWIEKAGQPGPGPEPIVPEYSMHGTADGQTWEDTPLTPSQGKETQYEVTNIDLTAGYTFVIQLAEGDWYNYNNVKNGCKDLVEKAAGESNDIVLKEEGTYNIYCDSVEGDQNGIWIEKAGQPGPGPEPEIKDYVLHGLFNGETEVWTDIALVQNKTKESEYYITNLELDAGDKFAVHMTGDTWFKFSDVKTDCKSLVDTDQDGNIVIKTDGFYDIYSDGAGSEGNRIWIQEHVPEVVYGYVFNTQFTALGGSGDAQYRINEDFEIPASTVLSFAKKVDGEQSGLTIDEGDISIDPSIEANFQFDQATSSLTVLTAGKYCFDVIFVEGEIDSLEVSEYKAMATVTFTVQKDIGMGNAMYIIGDFCNWDITKAARGSYDNTSGTWTITVQLEIGSDIEYKLAIAAWDKPATPNYEGGGNRTLSVTGAVTIPLTWQN